MQSLPKQKLRGFSAYAAGVLEQRLTNLSKTKLSGVGAALWSVRSADIAGDFVEFGVGLGGSSICIASELDDRRHFVGFDVFESIRPPSQTDGVGSNDQSIPQESLIGIDGERVADFLECVAQNFKDFGLDARGNRIRLVKGRFQETLPANGERAIAFAHIDCDQYDSVSYCLDFVYQRLSEGGILILDDYQSSLGCKAAVDEFGSRRPNLAVISRHPHAVLKKFRAPALWSGPTIDDLQPRWTSHYGFDGRGPDQLFRQGEDILDQETESAEGWALIGRAAHLSNNPGFAASALDRAVDYGHSDPSLRPYLARLWCEVGELEKARKCLAASDSIIGRDYAAAIAHLCADNVDAAVSAFVREAMHGAEYAVPADWGQRYFARSQPYHSIEGTALRSPPTVAILDYKSPDLRCCSDNLGDYMQTLAVLQILVGNQAIRWRCDDARLTEFISELRADTQSSQDIWPQSDVRLIYLDRDALRFSAREFGGRQLWLLLYGWNYHSCYGAIPPWPMADNVSALIFSFHLAAPELLSRPTLDWLKRFEPVGCRDWNTVGWLLNQGIQAFFTGCVTTTVSLRRPSTRVGPIAVDIREDRRPTDSLPITHAESWLRVAKFDTAMRHCLERVQLYCCAKSVITSRLHCYLPCRALHTPVELVGPHSADLRLQGLADLTDDELSAMARDLRQKISAVLSNIARGGDEAQVLQAWREMTSGAVEEARSRFRISHSRKQSPGGAAARGASPEAVQVAVSVTPATLRAARVLLGTAQAMSGATISATIISKSADRVAIRAFNWISACRSICLAFHSSDRAITDRLALANALPKVDRMVYLAPVGLLTGDLAELSAYIPGPSGLAARPSTNGALKTLGHAIEQTVKQLSTNAARRLRELAVERTDLAGPYFDPRVCVMSLDTLRRNGAQRWCEEFVSELGIDEWLALQLFDQGGIAVLPNRWNVDPYCEIANSVELMVWPDYAKPWSSDRRVLHAARWHREEERLNKVYYGTVGAGDYFDLPRPFTPRQGLGWTATMPSPLATESAERQAAMRLFEDDRSLGPTNAMEIDICRDGEGRYAVWPTEVCFSTSDASDPNWNGRCYRLFVPRVTSALEIALANGVD
jgi:predicted O-methyltransferase YrrM